MLYQVQHPGVRENWWRDGKCVSCGCWSGLKSFNVEEPDPVRARLQKARVIGEGVVICICCVNRNTPEDNQQILADLMEAMNMR